MKNLLVILVLLAVGGYSYYSYSSKEGGNSLKRITSPNSTGDAINNVSDSNSEDASVSGSLNSKKTVTNPYEDIKPAPQLYKTVDEALDAVLVGAKDYDDLVLEQFVDIGNNCSWCGDFFTDITQRMFSEDVSEDEKSYFAEILAISGSVDNIAVLTDAIKNSQSEDDADIFAEALELSMGDDKVVDYLDEFINSDNELLAESSVAAITNHGTRKAIDVLYKHTVESGDADGFYSLGIGLGEIIPDKNSLPFLIELADKKDNFSHLAVKSLLNYGSEGFDKVLGLINSYEDGQIPKGLLEDAVDHVIIDDETEAKVNKALESAKNTAMKDFLNEVKEDIALEDNEDDDLEDDEDSY